MKEIAKKEQNRVEEVRDQMLALASTAGVSLQEILHFERGRAKGFNRAFEKVKFRNPSNPDQTWAGRGKRPRWLQEALAEGADLDDFAVV